MFLNKKIILFFLFFLIHPKVFAFVNSTVYQRDITINNSSGPALTDYQILVTLNTSQLISASKMRSDCADLRVLDSDQSTNLSYWIESGCNTSSTNIWVKVPSISATTTKTIYFYYGNNALSSLSSGTSTFYHFEDFNTLDSANWTATGTASASAGRLLVSTGSVYSTASVSAQPNMLVEAKMKWVNVTGTFAGFATADKRNTVSSNGTGAKLTYILNNGGSTNKQEVVMSAADGTTSTYNIAASIPIYDPILGSPNTFSETNDTDYIFGSVVTSTLVRSYVNRTASRNFSTTAGWTAPTYLWFGAFNGSNAGTSDGGDISVDWTLTRKYTATPPTISIQTELQIPTAPAIYKTLAGNTKVLLAWNPPSLGTPVTDYSIQYRTGSGSWNTFADGTSTATSTLVTGLTNDTSYDFQVAAINTVGTGPYSTSTTISPTSLSLSGILVSGQSFALGYNGAPALSTTQPYSNVKVNSAITDLVPLIEDTGVESPMSGMANLLTRNTSSNAFQAVMMNNAVAGAAYSALKKGTTPYQSGLDQISFASTSSSQLARGFVVRAIANFHGPADSARASSYAGYLNEWQSDSQTDIKAITGQSQDIPMFIDQSSNFTGYSDATSPLVIAQLTASENNSLIKLIGPKYQFTYFTDNLHLVNTSYTWLGEYYGKAIRRYLTDPNALINLHPASEIVRKGNVITARFSVPVEPLVLDTTHVLAKSSYGFEFYDNSGATPSISSVALYGTDSVRITLSATPSGATQELRYAYTGTPNATPGAQSAGSARGNLRDSDTEVGASGNPLYNWAVHFAKTVTADSTAPTISAIGSSPTTTGSTLTWTTNEAASSLVEYGVTSSLGTLTAETDTVPLVTSHTAILSNLLSCTIYFYTLKSTDFAGNQQTSAAGSFVTSGCAGNATVEQQAISPITLAGGTLSLVSGGQGLDISIPASYATLSATFQMKQFDAGVIKGGIGTPTGRSFAGKAFDLEALTSNSARITNFLQPITVTFHYQDSDVSGLDLTSLKIYHYSGSSWQQLSSCVINTSLKTVSCQTTSFSIFGLFGLPTTPVTYSSPAASQMSSAGTHSSTPQPPTCTDIPPGFKQPKIYSAASSKKGAQYSITLYFTATDLPADHYSVMYGTQPGVYKYADLNIPGNDPRITTVSALKPNTTYYFKVRGGNGCATGVWSNEFSTKTLPRFSTNKNVFTFKNLLGKVYRITQF